MDSGTTPLQSPGFLGTLTTVNLVIIALLALLTIIGIAYGMKLARARRQGLRELEDGSATDVATPTRDVAPPVDRTPAPVVPPAPAAVPLAPATQVERTSEPVVSPTPAVATAATAPDTDLTRLKGLGPKVAAMLVEQGIPDIATLATLDAARADAVAAELGMFAPRMSRDRWVEQARLLAAGDVAGFEARFGKL